MFQVGLCLNDAKVKRAFGLSISLVKKRSNERADPDSDGKRLEKDFGRDGRSKIQTNAVDNDQAGEKWVPVIRSYASM